MFLIAGHEVWVVPVLTSIQADLWKSTAHTLGFAFGLLALYPEEQDTLYKHICTALPDGRSPVRSIYDVIYFGILTLRWRPTQMFRH